ncbi:MAG: FAD binding domain-containing protein [Streptosporangiaceae bacterium]
MKPPPLAYFRPASTAEMYERLLDDANETKVLAGGQSLIPLLNLRLAQPEVLLDIAALPGLDEVAVGARRQLRIGAKVTQRMIGASPVVRAGWPVLGEASSFVGHPQIRSRGTVVGSTVHADPSAEVPAVLRLLDATILLGSAQGERSVAAKDFFQDHYTTSIEATELALEISIPPVTPGTGSCFTEFSFRRGDFALVGVAATVRAETNRLADVRVCVAGCSGVPLRFEQLEAQANGHDADDSTLCELADAVADQMRPIDDPRIPASYRLRLARHFIRVALRTALARARDPAVGEAGGPGRRAPR